MRYKEQQESNKLIAQFMGGKITHTKDYEMPHGSHSTGTIEYWDGIRSVPTDGYEDAKMGIFGYNWSWDWLMPVVEKIESLGTGYVMTENNKCEIVITLDNKGKKHFSNRFIENSKIESTYLGVVEFIKWYNQNK